MDKQALEDELARLRDGPEPDDFLTAMHRLVDCGARFADVDLQGLFELLAASSREDSFLIVTVSGTEDFLQFYFADEYVMDFPVITAHQKEVEERLLSAVAELGLTVEEVYGSDGSKFYDIPIPGTSGEVAATSDLLLRRLFEVGPETLLEFECNM